jgi:hypothetical protein
MIKQITKQEFKKGERRNLITQTVNELKKGEVVEFSQKEVDKLNIHCRFSNYVHGIFPKQVSIRGLKVRRIK